MTAPTPTPKQLVQHIFDALSQGDSRPLVDAMADDFVWTIVGQTAWSRSFEGKHAVLTQLFGALRAVLEGRIRTTAQRVIAEGDLVVVEACGSNVTRTGVRYDNRYCYVIRVAGGRLQDLTEYADTELVRSALGTPVFAAGHADA